MNSNRRYFCLFFVVVFLISISTVSAAAKKDLFYLNGKVNLNSATSVELQKLPFVGERKAKSIITYRDLNGPFKKSQDILNVDGIGDDTYLSIKPYLSTSGGNDLQYSKEGGKGETKTIVIESFDGLIEVLDNLKYFHVLRDRIQKAEDSIYLCMYLFKTTKSKKNYSNIIMHELITAAQRGVRVKVLLEENNRHDDSLNISNKWTARRLRSGGVTVRFDSPKNITHSKLVVIDSKTIFLGSHNLSHTALSKSNETSLLIEDREMARYFINYIEEVE